MRNIRRRLLRVEETIPLPFTPERFSARVQKRMKQTGESFDVATKNLMRGLTEAELEWIVAEGERAELMLSPAEIEAARLEVFGELMRCEEVTICDDCQ